tara:strand:- start:102 stop:587 length:486 start_codon:yes stop_codon:yes gene_type:complete
MADIQIKEVSESEAIRMWNRDNPDDPFSRQAPSWYDIRNWIVRTNDGEVVAIAGYTDMGDYAILGGMKARSKDKPKGGGNWKALLNYRKNILGNKPKIAGFRATKMPQAKWTAMNERAGYQRKDMMGVPKELTDKFTERYGDDWGIMKNTSWFFPMMRGLI